MFLYNLSLTYYFKAHINVKVYSSIQAIKYIYKYIYKNYDCNTIKFDIEKDEIEIYFQGRYIGCIEVM